MKAPTRVTIALDKEASELLDRLKSETKLSQSGVIRRALRFYSENKEVIDKYGSERINTYCEMLAHGEHIILDVDHFILFLKSIESSPEEEKFWEDHERVAKSHAEQLPRKIQSVEGFLKRLEACNFYKLNKIHEDEFTLILYSDVTKKFVRTLLEDVLEGMGFKTEIKEDFAKLRVRVVT
ncbi:MAG: ribbon-helix-helix protein, CopG family [Candidatus Hydrothermarchaeales archaeon]